MKILRLSTLSLILTIAVITLGISADVWAAPGACSGPKSDRDPGCGAGGQPNNDTADCQIDFSVEFSDVIQEFDAFYVIRGDGKGAYPDPVDSKDKSGGGTGSGSGFRFDTNGKMQVVTDRDRRRLKINLGALENFDDISSGVDFRFHLPALGLDLCSLDKGESDSVPMILAFADGGTEWNLLYDCIFHDTHAIFGGRSDKAQVTRTKGTAGGWQRDDTWTITGTDACLISSQNYATATDDLEEANVLASFKMKITAK